LPHRVQLQAPEHPDVLSGAFAFPLRFQTPT
jgi:hypothetical protein